MQSRLTPGKVKFLPAEKWSPLKGYKGANGQRYAVSNHGRIVAYWNRFNYGYIMKFSFISNYPGIQLRKNGTGKGFLVHRLVAGHFCSKPSAKHRYVVHLDYEKENNHHKNLKWVTLEEKGAHQRANPNASKAWATEKGKGHKLTIDKVKLIKKKLKEGKTTIVQLSKLFKVSDTMLTRIKNGQNWAGVTV
jgi:hypothetical protein